MSRSRVVCDQADGLEGNAHCGQLVACPRCTARFVFCRSEDATIDACGFESYTFACKECGASLTGIIDPLDDALLITEVTA
jgi:hypothetical protein